MPEILLTSGISIPSFHEEPNRNGSLEDFLNAQILVDDPENGYFIARKNSKIALHGEMIVAHSINNRAIVYISDLTVDQLHRFLTGAGDAVQQLKGICPNNDLTLFHCNQSDECTYNSPQELSNPRLDKGIKNSQSLGILHAHIDSMNTKSLQKINQWSELRWKETERLKSLGLDKKEIDRQVNIFMQTKRWQANIGIFDKIAKVIWDAEMKPDFLRRYPDLFNDNCPKGLTLELRQGWESFSNYDFAEAFSSINSSILTNWQEFNELIQGLRHPDDKRGLDIWEEYSDRHQSVFKYKSAILRLSQIVKDRKPFPYEPDYNLTKEELIMWDEERRSWLHPDFNYTIAVYQLGINREVLVVNPKAKINSGAESIDIHIVRDPKLVEPKKIAENIKFGADFTRRLLASNSRFILGPEGEHLLQVA